MDEPERPKREMQQRAVWTRQKLLDAAGRIFEKEGYEGTTVNAILEAAGLAKGAFYHHFNNKEEVAKAILESTLSLDALQPQEIKLQEVFDTGMLLAHGVTRQYALRAALRLSLTFNARDTYGTPWPDWIRINTAQLDEAMRRGELWPDVDTGRIAHQIAGPWAGLVLVTHAIDGHLKNLEDRVVDHYEGLLTYIANPRCLLKIDFSKDRGRQIYEAYLGR